MQDAPTLEATKEDAPPLRHWLLHSARLDHRIIDKTIATLTEEDCFSVADLVLLRGLPRFKTLFTAVTKEKLEQALDVDSPRRQPLSLDEAPSWLPAADDDAQSILVVAGIADDGRLADDGLHPARDRWRRRRRR